MHYVILGLHVQRSLKLISRKATIFIGGLKTNRIIYPQGIRTSLKDFATYIKKDDVRLVTVNHQSYWVYRYEGALNDLDNAVVLFLGIKMLS